VGIKLAPSVLLAVALLLAPAACKRRQKSQTQTSVNAQAVLPASTIAVGDPQYSPQLLRGFYGIEQSWRWTQKSFAVRLVTPSGSAQRGAQLQLRFGIPDPIIQNLNSITLSASVDGFQLAPQRFEKSGQFTHTREVTADHLQVPSVTVDFVLDRALPPSAKDKRELGIVVTEVGLTAN
jgi:hypothetical protein